MNFLRLCSILFTVLYLAGCGPTYPKENLEQSVVDVCKKEYNIDIKAQVVGRTLAVYIPLPRLINLAFGIDDETMDKIQNVVLTASRVVLSTDAGIQFYCVIAQDIRMPELQLVIINYVEDLKRRLLMDVSRGEYMKRTIWDITMTPQAQKEEHIRDIIRKYNLNVDAAQEDEMMEDFFRSAPLNLKDFGYWQDRFFIKDITLPEFLAEQMSYRLKLRFRSDKELSGNFQLRLIESEYDDTEGPAFFRIKFDVMTDEVLSALGQEMDRREVFRSVVEEVCDVIYDYKFQDFADVVLTDIKSNSDLKIEKSDVYALKKNKLDMDIILSRIAFMFPAIN